MVDDNSTFLIERDGHMDIVADDWHHAFSPGACIATVA
jgi:hypothetical protein